MYRLIKWHCNNCTIIFDPVILYVVAYVIYVILRHLYIYIYIYIIFVMVTIHLLIGNHLSK